MNDEPKQLKLTPRSEGDVKGKKEKREKEEKANKWMVVLVLLATIIVSLIFYASGGWSKQAEDPGMSQPTEKGSLFGPKIYEF